jgi:hypothetical protein
MFAVNGLSEVLPKISSAPLPAGAGEVLAQVVAQHGGDRHLAPARRAT